MRYPFPSNPDPSLNLMYLICLKMQKAFLKPKSITRSVSLLHKRLYMSGSGQELSQKDASVNQEAGELSVGSSKAMVPVLPAEECSSSYCHEVKCRVVGVGVCGCVCVWSGAIESDLVEQRMHMNDAKDKKMKSCMPAKAMQGLLYSISSTLDLVFIDRW